IQYLAVDRFYPEWDVWTQYVADVFSQFLVLDALKSSHPIEVPIGHPSEIDGIFDTISYATGSSVIRMLHDYIGDDAFRKGLHNYLKDYSYKNTVTFNLWSHLAKASGKPLIEGYPLVTVYEEQQLNKTRVIKLTQQRFIADGSTDDDNLQWTIPITIFTKSNPKSIAKEILMDKPEITITLENISEDDWIKLNYNSIGLYRVKYELKTLARLNEPIANKILSPQDRLMIQDDIAALCNAGHQSFVDYLKLLLSYKDEDNFTVWKSIASTIGNLSSLLEYTDYFDQFKKYRLNLCSSIQNRIGWDATTNENPLVAMLRPIILTLLGKSDDQAIIDEAKYRFQQHMSGNLIDPNIRPAVYVVVSHYGDKNSALSRVGRDIVWKFLQKNWTELVERFGENSVFLIDFVEVNINLFHFFHEADHALIYLVWLMQFPNTSTVTLAVKQVIETIKMRSNVLKRDSKAIEEYLLQ
ncbi:unnamed protein product, partial [Adineta steineri]